MTSPMPAYRRPDPPSTRMHKSSLAPVLSATLSRDSCWITSTPACSLRPDPARVGPAGPRWSRLLVVRVLLLRLLRDLRHAPALGRRQRPGLPQHHAVANATGIGLVVRHVLPGPADDLAVLRMLDPVLDHHDDGLVHLVADYQALPDLPVAARRSIGGLLTHLRQPPAPASRCRVRAHASPCRYGQSPCGRRGADRGFPTDRSLPGSGD